MIPHDPFGRSRPSLDAETLEQRVLRLIEAAQALRAGRTLDPATAGWLADGLERFLYAGEPFDKSLGLRARRGSHRTAHAIADVKYASSVMRAGRSGLRQHAGDEQHSFPPPAKRRAADPRTDFSASS